MEICDRLLKLTEKDRKTNPKYLINVIKSDFFYLISNYLEVQFNDILVDIKTEGDKYKIEINCEGDRLKTFKALPD